VDSTRLASFLLLVVASFVVASCGGQKNIAANEKCHEQIVVSLSPGVMRTDRVEDGLQDDAKVKLEYLRSTSPTLFVYSLSAKGRDPGCKLALVRLRQDSRVRFAEPDLRRTVNGFN
jgi:hypothetical protein